VQIGPSPARTRLQLASVTFAEGLGSLLERAERLEWLAGLRSRHLALAEAETGSGRRPHVCRHDLVSQMVGEFRTPGRDGGQILLAERRIRGRLACVLEHYRRGEPVMPYPAPRPAPSSRCERLEFCCSVCYAKGDRPSGLLDPYALRRQETGWCRFSGSGLGPWI